MSFKKSLTRASLLIPLLVLFLNSYSQNTHTVSGRIIDAEDEAPLIGATIIIKGSTTGTVTDLDGNYSIAANPQSDTLVYQYIGYISKEIAINGLTSITVPLTPNVSQLDEVVVTALGITREEKSLGYSIGQVSSEDLNRVAQKNVLNALSGKVSGVTISSTGGPGSSSQIIIRGATSLNSDNQPLFIVDGVPISSGTNNVSDLGGGRVDYGNAISDINPNDIENVSVLKGPSAAALYGSRAANGVIMITTKSGKNKKQGIGVYFNTGVTFDVPYKYLPQQTEFTSGALGLALYEEENGFWYGPMTDMGLEAPQWAYDGEKAPLVAYPNKTKDFIQTGVTYDNNVGVTGNYEKGSFRLSFANMTNKGVIPNTDLNRNTLSLATNYFITKNVNITTNFNLVDNSSDNLSAGGRSAANVLYALDNTAPHISLDHLSGNYWEPGMENTQQRTFAKMADNPYFIVNEFTNSYNRDRLYGNVMLNTKFLNNFSAFGRLSLNKSETTRETKVPWSYSEAPYGAYGISKFSNKEINADFLTSYNDTFNDFQINVSFGGNYRHEWLDGLTNRASRLTIPGVYTISNAEGGPTTYINSYGQKAVYSLYGLVNMSYKNLIYLDITGRNDWSSNLPPESRSYFYPSASVSLLVNEMVDLGSSIDLIKLRGGIAQVGSDHGYYSEYTRLGISRDWGNLKRVYQPGNLFAMDLKPEMATSFEIGADFVFFKNRLSIKPTYYVVQNKNQVLSLTDIPASSGFSSQQVNAGLIQSNGWEIDILTVPIRTKNWNWNLDFHITRTRTKILELVDGMPYYTLYEEGGVVARTMVGENIGDLWGQDYLRVEDKNSEYYGYPLLVINEDYGGADLQKAPESDRVKLGNFNHDFLIGVQTAISYKSFTLSANINWRQGGEFFSGTMKRRMNLGRTQETLEGVPYNDINNIPAEIKADPDKYFGGWVGGMSYEYGGFDYPTGTNNFIYNLGNAFAPGSAAFIPGVYQDVNGNYIENLGDPATTLYSFTGLAVGAMWNQSYQYIFDASYVKLREISLSYNLPTTFTKKAGIQKVDVTLFATNIMIWTANEQNIDPE
ncbi:MAG: SusC/RagA family TonB-linked outer membrane protein, partial [Bacteroidales bacterium]|nr:SusC/RagA family TonB-linked outer membrane protein [Bacteroidales bacterium]